MNYFPDNNKIKTKTNNSKLTKLEFLKFLKSQRAKNVNQGILPPILEEDIPMANQLDNNNAKANHSDVIINKQDCVMEEGLNWNNEKMNCEELKVKFYSQEGEEGSSFKLGKGNYNETEIKKLEFIPTFMSIPMGLRVKIWHKSGYVGPNLGFLGNNNPKIKGKKNLFPVDKIGSLQICNMKNCVKPNEYGNMNLINLIDGYNIDFVEDNVNNLGEYKEKLREKIHKKLFDIKYTHKDCLKLVSNYLLEKDIDIEKNLADIDNSFNLQKILHEITNIPKCDLLIKNKSLVSTENNLNLSPIETNLSPIETNLSPIETNLSPIETIIDIISPSPSQGSLGKIETQSINFIIIIFILLLILLIIGVLVYLYISTPKIK